MPLPMVHLSIAIEMHSNIKQAVSPDFLLGSLSPDAIHMRLDSTREDKRRTHLKNKADPDNFDVIHTLLDDHQSTEANEFSQGYAVHILTDLIWVKRVVRPFRAALPENASADEVAKLYYQDTDQIDVNLYNNQPWRPSVWAQLTQAKPIDFAGLLTASEIDQWRDRTFRWFDDMAQTPMIDPINITDAIVQDFILHAAQEITDYFEAWHIAVSK